MQGLQLCPFKKLSGNWLFGSHYKLFGRLKPMVRLNRFFGSKRARGTETDLISIIWAKKISTC